MKKAIVVGSGFGGIASALRLRKLGFQVTILEKLDQIGGRARVFKKEGYTFDAGPTVITAPFLFDELFSLLKKTETEIEKFNHKDVEGYRKLLKFSEKIFNIGFLKLSFTPFHNFWFMIKQLPTLLVFKSYLSVFGLVGKFIKNNQLQQALSIQPLLLGGNPITTTSIYNLIHFLERKWGVHYAMGGTGALINGLKKLMLEEKIVIKKNSEVTKILTEKNKAIGVEINKEKTLFADKIIINADPTYTYQNLLKTPYNKKWNSKRVDKLDYSMGLFVIFLEQK